MQDVVRLVATLYIVPELLELGNFFVLRWDNNLRSAQFLRVHDVLYQGINTYVMIINNFFFRLDLGGTDAG